MVGDLKHSQQTDRQTNRQEKGKDSYLEVRATFQILWPLLLSKTTKLPLILAPPGQRDASVCTCSHASHPPLENRMPLIYATYQKSLTTVYDILNVCPGVPLPISKTFRFPSASALPEAFSIHKDILLSSLATTTTRTMVMFLFIIAKLCLKSLLRQSNSSLRFHLSKVCESEFSLSNKTPRITNF